MQVLQTFDTLIYGWTLHKMFQIAILTYQPTHVHVTLL
jgi:hypothetical protein